MVPIDARPLAITGEIFVFVMAVPSPNADAIVMRTRQLTDFHACSRVIQPMKTRTKSCRVMGSEPSQLKPDRHEERKWKGSMCHNVTA